MNIVNNTSSTIIRNQENISTNKNSSIRLKTEMVSGDIAHRIENFKNNSKPSWTTADGWKAYMEEHGQKREVGAILRHNGKPVALIDYDGKTTINKSIGPVYGNGMSERVGNIQSKLPGVDVNIFERGHGPTNAEAFEIFNARSFEEFIDEQYASMKRNETPIR